MPVLYFSVTRQQDGVPLSLDELAASPLVLSLPTSSVSSGRGAEAAAFPAVSQGDHPSTGRPSLYLHPCETAGVLASILAPPTDTLEYMESFVMLCASALEMRA